MNVLVDTSVWSLALRRREVDEESEIVRELRELIVEGSAVIIGPIRQELLSGIRIEYRLLDLRGIGKARPLDLHHRR